VVVGVYYPASKSGVAVGELTAKAAQGWELSNPFDVKPQLAGSAEGAR
jgi:hypothetical protein